MISDSKLKIMLTPQDMEYYELCNEEIDYDNTETRRAFWQILDEVKHKTGFDAAGEKVFIQLYPSKEGGCEMYVTKLDEVPSLPSGHARLPAEIKGGKPRCYLFSDLDRLLRVCRILYGGGYRGASEAYAIDDGGYALVICEYGKNKSEYFAVPDTYSFIEEYGTCATQKDKFVFLKEHGTCLCDREAVKKLGSLA